MLARMCRKGNPSTLIVGLQICAATLENSMQGTQNIQNRTTTWPSDSTPSHISENENTNLKKHMHSNAQSSIYNKPRHVSSN